MSQVARVFVVLNLLISAGFLFAAATFLALNDDWRGKYEGEKANHEADNQRKDLEIGGLNDKISSLEGENRALQEQRGELQGRADTLSAQVTASEAEKKAKDTQIADLTRNNNEFATTIANLRADKNDLVTKNEALAADNRKKTSERSEAVAAKDAVEKENLDLKNTIEGNERTIAKQKGDIGELELQKKYAISKGIDFENIEIMKPVRGSVVNADNGIRLVQMNIGESDGVQRGYVMDIVRGGTYIGRCRVDSVFASHCSGLITLLADGEQVMVGDRVTNTLN